MNKLLICSLASLSILLGALPYQDASAATISITGTLRDFCNPAIAATCTAHPNFESGVVSGVVPGMVSSTLGLDGNPVYIAGGAGATTSAADFNQWYNDVAGVNIPMPLAITLDDTGHPGIYTYINSVFFPADGLLFGNQGRPHNYHFTYEIHSQFTYMGGETFSFTGDDDVWVFINKQLVVDIGGVHGAASGSVSLDTLGLTVGNTYDFDMFFAERQTVSSSFRIDTSIALTPPEDPQVIGGKIIPIEMTSLILAGTKSISWMIPLLLSGIGIGLFVVSRKSENS